MKNCLTRFGKIYSYRGRKCVILNTNKDGKPTFLMGVEPIQNLLGEKYVNWNDAMQIDNELKKDGLGWRLPKKEDLINFRQFLINSNIYISSTEAYWIWTRTEDVIDKSRAWNLDLHAKDFFADVKSTKNNHSVAIPIFKFKQ